MLAIINADIRSCGPLGTIKNGTVVLRDGKIVDVGTKVGIPAKAEVIDVRGMVMTPGFVDAHTHLGVSWQELDGEADTNESTGFVNASLRVIDSVDPKDIAFQDAIEGGVTTVMIHPGKTIGGGSLSPIAGQSLVMKTYGDGYQREILREPAGMKFALGDEVVESLSKRKIGPNSRMGIAALIREQLHEAEQYRLERGGDTAGTRNLRLEALSRLLTREIAAHVHVHRAEDIRTMLRIVETYSLDVVLHHVTEGHLITDELAARRIPCVVGPITRPRSKARELENFSQRTAGILAAAGIKVALMTNHPEEPVQFLPILAGDAVREGMVPNEALRAITINAAEIAGVSARVGSIEAGKDADLVVHNGDPLEAMTRIQLVVAGGKVVVNKLNGGQHK